jgi:hypothetical protein
VRGVSQQGEPHHLGRTVLFVAVALAIAALLVWVAMKT